MADVTLSDGREITFDLYKINIQDYDRLRDPAQPRKEEAEMLARTCELTTDELLTMPYPDFIRFTRAFVERCRDPLPETPST